LEWAAVLHLQPVQLGDERRLDERGKKKGTCEIRKCLISFAGDARFERATFGSGDRRSIQLS
jgi:hypothetical protein